MKRLIILLALVASLSTAAASCLNVQWVEAVGYGAPGATADGGTGAALAAALAEAVVQVNGTFLQQLVQIESAVTTRLGVNGAESQTIDHFQERIEQSTAGVIRSFEIIDRDQEHGLLKLKVLAEVCADPRIVLDLSGELSAIVVIESEITAAVQGAGWRVAALAPLRNLNDPIEAFFATGATHVLRMEVFASGHENYRDLDLVHLEASATLTALSSSELTATYVTAAEGLGVTRDAAIRTAAASLAPELSSRLLGSLGGGIQEALLNVTVSEVHRPSTRFEVQDQLTALTGTELVGSIHWDEDLRVLNFSISSNKSACDAAAAVADMRRLLLNVESCRSGRIELKAVRE